LLSDFESWLETQIQKEAQAPYDRIHNQISHQIALEKERIENEKTMQQKDE